MKRLVCIACAVVFFGVLLCVQSGNAHAARPDVTCPDQYVNSGSNIQTFNDVLGNTRATIWDGNCFAGNYYNTHGENKTICYGSLGYCNNLDMTVRLWVNHNGGGWVLVCSDSAYYNGQDTYESVNSCTTSFARCTDVYHVQAYVHDLTANVIRTNVNSPDHWYGC